MKRAKCTKDNPYSQEREAAEGKWWVHDAWEEIGEEDGWPGGDIITVRCRNCGIVRKRELPQ